jgi:hypothetical protein
MRVNQVDEQLSNTLRAIDKFHADMEIFRDYTIENNKVVKSILLKLDDFSEKFDRMQEDNKLIMQEMAKERELREAQFAFLVKRLEPR